MKRLGLVIGAGALILGLAAWTKPNPNDQTKPEVVIKVQLGGSGEYMPMSFVKFSNGFNNGQPLTMNIACTVTDKDGGLKSASLTYSKNAFCTNGGQPINGTFMIKGLPPDENRTYKPKANGTVQDNAFFLSTMKGGMKCSVVGFPNATPVSDIKVTCKGENWSNNSFAKNGEAVLTVDLN